MDPNQQPNQTPQPSYPPQPAAPQTPTTYGEAPPPAYDPHYLDSIAPAPPRAKFFSGSFGKILFGMLGLFVLAVSLIIAFSGKDETADLQQIALRLDNFSTMTKTVQVDLKSNNLSSTNTDFRLWMTNSQHDSETLLKTGGVKKTDYSKTMIASEKKISDDLAAKFEDARLNAKLDRVYASTMAAETQKLINLFNSMAKKNKSSKIRDYAKNTSANLVPIQKSFDEYNDDGN
jgi:hypothetical protein